MASADLAHGRRSKIVCTLGPATASAERISDLVDAGMDVARLNFSHGDHADRVAMFEAVRVAAARARRTVGVLADLQGPKIRLGSFDSGPVQWPTGSRVTITIEEVRGTWDRVSTTYPSLVTDAGPGDRLLVDDGRLTLQVLEVVGPDVTCEVLVGGPVSDGKGLSLPGSAISVPALSVKDAADLEFALDLGVDLVALSFVRSPSDVEPVRKLMNRHGRCTPVIAKIERPEAVLDLEGIVRAFDGVMVARGDLGVELPLEQVPMVQKRAVRLCRELAKPVVIATQMLDSMITASRPTRAEVSDVANAVLDGADAVMLSGESSVGEHPVAAVRTMARIVAEVQSDPAAVAPSVQVADRSRCDLIAQAARDLVAGLDAAALVAFTQSGETVRRLARLHPPCPLLAFTPVLDVGRRLALSWGSEAFVVPPVSSTDAMIRQVDRFVLGLPRFQIGDLVVIVAGAPWGSVGSTNLLHVHRLGADDAS